MQKNNPRSLFFKATFLSIACYFSYAYASPTGAEVVAGGIDIQGQGTAQTVIHQSTTKAIINWQTFNIGENESVQFVTPGAHAATLNRITGGSASQILGKLSSNGQLWLINPSGIMFGKNAQVNVAGLVASTLNITDKNFMNGNYNFAQEGANVAKIVNAGSINADGGYVAMLAPQIENTGIIQAKLGAVALGAGTQATLHFQNNHLLHFSIGEGAKVPLFDENGEPVAALNHTGKITADGGRVLLTADSINSMLDQSINVTGFIQADTVEDQPGKIVLLARGNAIVDNASFSAQGKNAGEKGGKVEVIGHNIGLFGSTSINANGAAGGGEIRVGRDDTDPNAFMAHMTIVDRDVSLTARATQFGNGGFIETSGDYLTTRTTHVNTLGAGGGQSGLWLLDPYNVEICADGILCGTGNDSFDAISRTFVPSGSPATIAASDIITNLEGGNVTVTTSGGGSEAGNITVTGDITGYSGSNVLTLNADGAISIGANITIANLTLTAGTTISQTAGAVTSSGTTTINGGSGSASLDRTSNNFGTVVMTAGAGLTLVDTNAVTLGAITSSGTLGVTAGGAVTQTGVLTVTGVTTVSASGQNVTLNNASNDFTGAVGITGANVSLRDTNALVLGASTVSGTLGVTTGGALTQSGALAVTGVTTLVAGSGNNITLDTSTNNFSTVGITSGNNVSLTDAGALVLGASTVSGTLGVTTGGALTQSGALAVTGTTTVNAGSNAVTLSNSSNNFVGNVTITSGTLSLTDANNLALSSIASSGSITILAQSGTITFASNAAPIISLTGATGSRTVTLASSQFNNTSTGSSSAIDVGSGSGNRWLFYLSNYTGNTLGNLSSGNDAIWSTSYPTAVTASGNRYVYAVANPNAASSTTPAAATTPSNNPGVIMKNLKSNLPPMNNSGGFVQPVTRKTIINRSTTTSHSS